MTRPQAYRLRRHTLLDSHPRCAYCVSAATEVAHIVANTKANHKKYGWWTVNHINNLVATCRVHNARAMQEARGIVAKNALMTAIQDSLIMSGVDPWDGRKNTQQKCGDTASDAGMSETWAGNKRR